MKKTTTLLSFAAAALFSTALQAQTEQATFTVNGAARSIFFLDNLEQDLEVADTITPPRESSGHAMVDLGINVRPADNLEVQGMVRIRNDFGGFWGSGVTFDIRQLYVKGVVKDIVRYQLGDINYQLTPYTLYNNDHELTQQAPVLLNHLTDVVKYDNFYNIDNSWRQQGAAVDFGLNFRSVIESMEFNVFTSRVLPSNLSSVNDRLFSTFNIGIVQSKYFRAGLNYANLYDLKGTSRNDQLLSNPVLTGTAVANYTFGEFQFIAAAETGTSSTIYFEDPAAPELSDVFFDGQLQVLYAPAGLQLTLGFKSVGPDFRSPGAQTKRINFGDYPASFARITNDQVLRPLTMMDLLRETSLYNLQIQNGLMAYNPVYDNITPYGAATPNRQGFNVGLDFISNDKNLEVGVGLIALTEIRGQGTTSLRSYNRTEANAVYHAGNSLFSGNRLLDISVNLRADQTSRDASVAEIPTVDLSTNIVGAGIEAEVIAQLDLVAGIQFHSYNGFEFTNRTNAYGTIINFDELMADGAQQMYGAGVRYRFNEKVYLMAQWNNFSISDMIQETIPDYNINNIALIYSMKF